MRIHGYVHKVFSHESVAFKTCVQFSGNLTMSNTLDRHGLKVRHETLRMYPTQNTRNSCCSMFHNLVVQILLTDCKIQSGSTYMKTR